jgi:hypothetical protein
MFQGLLPPIPNLQFGYLYSFSNNYGAGRVTGDYSTFAVDEKGKKLNKPAK